MTGQADGHIGVRIKSARRAKALSQNELARALDVREKTINRWETGRNEPRPLHIRALAVQLGCSVSWLIGESADEPNGDPVAA